MSGWTDDERARYDKAKRIIQSGDDAALVEYISGLDRETLERLGGLDDETPDSGGVTPNREQRISRRKVPDAHIEAISATPPTSGPFPTSVGKPPRPDLAPKTDDELRDRMRDQFEKHADAYERLAYAERIEQLEAERDALQKAHQRIKGQHKKQQRTLTLKDQIIKVREHERDELRDALRAYRNGNRDLHEENQMLRRALNGHTDHE